MTEYERVELYPSVNASTESEYGRFVAEFDDWKYTFEVQRRTIVLVEMTRPWTVGDPTPPEWVPASAEERVTVKRTSRTDIPTPVMTALLACGALGHDHTLTVRTGH